MSIGRQIDVPLFYKFIFLNFSSFEWNLQRFSSIFLFRQKVLVVVDAAGRSGTFHDDPAIAVLIHLSRSHPQRKWVDNDSNNFNPNQKPDIDRISFPIDELVLTDGDCESCTLTVMCWMNGGIREDGCSGPSWLMTCCVPQVTRSDDSSSPIAAGLRSAPGGAPFLLANSLGESIANLGRDDCKFFDRLLVHMIS